MITPKIIDFIVDMAPFAIYLAVLIKLYRSWKLIQVEASEDRRNKLAAVLLIAAVVIGMFLASNVYALVVYGKTYLSLRMFQLFIVGNCIVYWMMIDIIAKDSVPAQGKLSESSD